MSIRSFFKNVGKSFRELTLTQVWRDMWGDHYRSNAGITVNEDSAMKYSAYNRGVRIISETLAGLPLFVYKRTGDSSKTKDPSHYLYRVLHDKPNPYMDSFVWRTLAASQVIRYGNHYSQKIKNKYNEVIGLYPLAPWRIRPDVVSMDNYGVYKVYIYTPPLGGQKFFTDDEMLHIIGFSDDGIVGVSPLHWWKDQIGLGLAIDQYSSKFFENGMHAGGVFTTPKALKPETRDRLEKQLAQKYAGVKQAYGTMVLEEDLKFDKIAVNPEDAQLLESKKFQIQEIARLLGIPLHLLMELDQATNNNIEHQGIDFVTHCMLPWLRRFESAFSTQLFKEDDLNHYAEFLVDGLLRGDMPSRYSAYSVAKQNGIMSANEIRAIENMNPYDGGDIYTIQLNMQDVSQMGQLPEPVEPKALSEPVTDPKMIEDKSNISLILIERLSKAYKPLFKNAFTKIIKCEIKDIPKENDLEKYFEKHSKFINTRIKPVIYAFSDALFAEINGTENDIIIFTEEYTQDFTQRYIEDSLIELKSLNLTDIESILKDWEENRAESLSFDEVQRISALFVKYVEKIG